MKIKIISKNNKGFTLIETLVSLALFSIVLVITGGVIVSIIQVNKKNQAVSSVVNNLNYSIDSMIRDIKTGYLYKCEYVGQKTIVALKSSTDELTNKCDSLTLISTISGQDVVVQYDFVIPEEGNSYIEKTVYNEGGVSSPYSITDKMNVNITDLNFFVNSPDSLDTASTTPGVSYGQPSVFVSIKGVAGSEDVNVSKFFIQTFISQRLINLTDFKDEN